MKTAKNLLIPFIIMILLAVGVVVFFAIDKRWSRSPAQTSVNSVDVLYISPVDVASVSVLHKENNLTVRVDKKTSNNGSDSYIYAGDDKDGDSYSQSELSIFMEAMSSFVGCTPVQDSKNLADFGLDAPNFTVTVKKTDGSTVVILIGNLSPDSESCYICAQGSSEVYMVTADRYKSASKVAKDFLDSRIIKVSLSGIESVRFVRKKDSVDLSASCNYDESADSVSFRFNKPFEIDSSAYFDRLIERICDLEANEYEDASSDNLLEFGLTNPAFTVTLKMKNGMAYMLDFSSAKSGFYYGRLNGTGKVFKIAATKLESLEIPVLSFINSYVFNDPCENVISVECSDRDRKFVMKLDVPKDKAISDAGSTVTLDGRNAKVSSITGRSYAAMLYESIFCIDIGGVDEYAAIPENARPMMTITVFDRNHSSVVYDFYRRSDDSYYVCKNGQYTKFYVYQRELYNDGGTDTYDYGIWPAYEILTKAITNQINGIYEIPTNKENA